MEQLHLLKVSRVFSYPSPAPPLCAMNFTGGVPGREGVREKGGGDGRQAVSACIFPGGPGQEGSVEEED